MRIQEAIDILEEKKRIGYEFMELSKEKSNIYGGIKFEFFQCPYCTPENSKLCVQRADIIFGTK